MVPFTDINNQWWRVITGHLTHTNTNHLLMNAAGFIIICAAFARETRWLESLIVISCICLMSSLCLGLFTDIHYFGLSSLLHGYLLYFLIAHWRTSPKLHSLFIIAIILKVIGETTQFIDTQETATLIGAKVAVESHLYGGIAGLILSLLKKGITPRQKEFKNP